MKKLTLFILGVVFSHSLAFSQGCLPEGITFTTQAQIDNFQTNYPGCTEIEGDVTIHGITITNLNGLSVLASIGGNLSINSSALINLTGLNNTTTIGGSLMFGDPIQGGLNDSLTSLTGLEGLTSIGGGLGIHSTNRLTSLTGLENVTSIDENLFISYNNALASLGGLEGVTSIGGDLIIFANDALSSLTGLENVISIAGSVNLYYINSLTNLSGLTNVTSIGGNIYIADCALASMEGLEKISTIGGALSLVGNNNLSSLSEFDSLTSAGSLEIIGNPLLNSLSGLNNVTSIAGNIFINSNQSLTSLNGLENINAGSIAGLNITTNSSLSTCEVQSICGYLASPNGTVDISNNAPGCNSTEEVEAACEQHCLPDGITFTTQEQIDNFQTNYPGCTEIEGDVYIPWVLDLNGLSVLTAIGGDFRITGNNERLANLTGLNNLTSVGGTLQIGDTQQLGPQNDSLFSLTGLENLSSIGEDLILAYNYSLNNLSGLANLVSIGGNLTIMGNYAMDNIAGLENLTSIGGALTIYGNGITSLNGLENINPGSITDLNISWNNQLSNCEVQSICNYLSSPNGVVNITHNDDGCNSPTEIANACGITIPCLPYGNYYFFSQADVDNFQTDYPGCSDLQGNVSINGDDIFNLTAFSGVSSISGDLNIGRYYNDTPYGNPVLTSLTGFENLTRIGGTLLIIRNDTLTSLSGLDNLSSIGNDLLIGVSYVFTPKNMEALTSIHALGSLTSIGGEMYISSTSMSSLTGLDNVSTIGGNITIYYNDYLTDISSLNKLTSIAGKLEIGYTALSSLEGLNNVTTIDRSLRINKNHSLKNFEGLNNLSYIGTGAWISYNDSLTSFEGLNNLEYIDGYLYIWSNPTLSGLSGLENLDSIGSILHISQNGLTSLSALSGLQSIKESLYIINNDQLTSLSGLDHVFADSIAELKIFNNALLQTCDVQSICDYLASPNGTVDIHDNAPGCNSQEEVVAACEQHCLPEGITFTTQEQIDNFQTNYPGCREIEGDVIIHGDNIENLNGLIALTSIGGNTYIEDDESLTSLNGLNNLAFIGGDLNLTVGNLINFTGLEGLTYIGGNFEIRDDFVLINLTGLDNLASIGGYLSIGPRVLGGSGPPTIIPNTTLTSLTGLNSLTTIGGDLTIYGNDALTNLVALENLTSIGGDLKIGISNYADLISGNSSLTGLIGLENVDASSINNITIVDNSSLTKCEVQSICNYLVSPHGIIEIYDNAPGCSSPEEVNAACTFSVEPVGLDNEIFIYPNPACKTVTISGSIAKAIREILIYNQTGQRILQSKSINNPLDISKLRPGMYIVELVTDQGKVREKLVVE
ncbi:MAG: T9SS type A sorting domain-containing protein [Lentimicrobium sp.]